LHSSCLLNEEEDESRKKKEVEREEDLDRKTARLSSLLSTCLRATGDIQCKGFSSVGLSRRTSVEERYLWALLFEVCRSIYLLWLSEE